MFPNHASKNNVYVFGNGTIEQRLDCRQVTELCRFLE